MVAEKRDYYEVLGVARTAAPDEIKRAYRQAALQATTPTATANPSAEEHFKEGRRGLRGPLRPGETTALRPLRPRRPERHDHARFHRHGRRGHLQRLRRPLRRRLRRAAYARTRRPRYRHSDRHRGQPEGGRHRRREDAALRTHGLLRPLWRQGRRAGITTTNVPHLRRIRPGRAAGVHGLLRNTNRDRVPGLPRPRERHRRTLPRLRWQRAKEQGTRPQRQGARGHPRRAGHSHARRG